MLTFFVKHTIIRILSVKMFTKTFSFELETKIVFTMKIECNTLSL